MELKQVFRRILLAILLTESAGLLPIGIASSRGVAKQRIRILRERKESNSFEDTDASSKGLVSSLTNIVNFFSFNNKKDDSEGPEAMETTANTPPKTPNELLERIRDDYRVRNYLWTGDIDLAAFDPKCRFTDPTLSFEGTDQFVKNLNNLVPIVDALVEPGGCKSDLLQIELNEEKGYVQSRWNMVGSLTGLPWSPMIDVVSITFCAHRRAWIQFNPIH